MSHETQPSPPPRMSDEDFIRCSTEVSIRSQAALGREAHRARSSEADLLKRLEAAERAFNNSCDSGAKLNLDNAELRRALSASQARETALWAALDQWGHDEHCARRTARFFGDVEKPCDCNIADALATPASAPTTRGARAVPFLPVDEAADARVEALKPAPTPAAPLPGATAAEEDHAWCLGCPVCGATPKVEPLPASGGGKDGAQ